MLPYIREHFFYRICSGYLKYKVGKYNLKIHHPSLEVKLRSCEIYERVYNKCKSVLVEDNVLQFMYQYGLWTSEDQKKLDILPKQIEDFKVHLYENYKNSNKVEQIRKYLEEAERVLLDTNIKRHAWDHITREGIANFAKWQYTIEHSTYYGREKWKWQEGSSYQALNHYYQNLISDTVIRELSHNPPFDSIWPTKKFNKVFCGRGLTLDQQKLIGWARFYDSLHKAAESPPREVIDDDDFLDGWCIIQKKKRDQEDTESAVQNILKNPKIANADEIYLPVAGTVSAAPMSMTAEEIQRLNSPQAKNLIKQRIDQVKRAGGELNQMQLEDVKQKLQIEVNKKLFGH